MNTDRLSVTLVLHDFCKGWIIEKIAHKLCEALTAAGVDAEVRNAPSSTSQVNHFMIFHYVDVLPDTINTVAVTHIDDALKVDMVKRQLSNGVRAMVCQSRMALDQIAGYGCNRAQLTTALPAHDVAVSPRRIVIGITSNCYSDNRKREWMLHKLAHDTRLDAFEFRIFGKGWNETVAALENGGARVIVTEPTDDYRGDYSVICAAVPQFDYYFYPGLDEGSWGVMDALSAGVKTIITRQGYHLDLPHGITHGFWDYPEMLSIFKGIKTERQARIDVGRQLTWAHYARRHAEIWLSLIEKDALPPLDQVNEGLPPKSSMQYQIIGYREILANRFRREMALRFWMPGLYDAYRKARFGIGAWRRRLLGRADLS